MVYLSLLSIQRALQYNDQKKLYLAAMGIAERSSRKEIVEQMLKAMCKKFSTSAKVRDFCCYCVGSITIVTSRSSWKRLVSVNPHFFHTSPVMPSISYCP